MYSTLSNDFNDIKKYSIFLQENIYLYFLPYEDSSPYVKSMQEQIEGFYPELGDRKEISKIQSKLDEFIVSRWLYKKVMETEFNSDQLVLKKYPDSSIEFPLPYRLSLSHKKGDVLLGISSEYKGIGVDIERGVKLELQDKILTDEEYSFFDFKDISQESILGLIFSFKESIFKAVYPTVRRMFYFKDARISKIDFNSKKIEAQILFDHPDLEDKTVYGKFHIVDRGSYIDIITLAWI